MKSSAVIFLAAGMQTRFEGEGLKCMSDIGGKPLLEHTADMCREWNDLFVVIGAKWTNKDELWAFRHGIKAIRAEGPKIGGSIVAGLVGCDASLYEIVHVVSADTFFVEGSAPVFGSYDAIFDPWEWATLWGLTGGLRDWKLYAACENRVETMGLLGMHVRIVRRPDIVNVNTVEDLERARRLWRDSGKQS